MNEHTVEWVRVAHVNDLAEGRVITVTPRQQSICLVHFQGRWAALDNRCPHQGGPLGEGSIEQGVDGQSWLRCPWHGWDFDPLSGKPPGGHDDSGQASFPVEVRGDEVFVGLAPERPHQRTVSDVMAETLVAWGVKRVFGMVGHSNLGLADAVRRRVVWETELRNPSFSAFARLCGGRGQRVTDRSALDQALSEALAFSGPSLVEIVTDPELV